jgi:hypothetical protein
MPLRKNTIRSLDPRLPESAEAAMPMPQVSLANGTRLRLLADDYALLFFTFTAKYVRTDQYAAFRRLQTDKSYIPAALLRTVQRRLRQLVAADMLRRIEQPVFLSDRTGSMPYVYALGPLGVHIVAEVLGLLEAEMEDAQPHSRERSPSYLAHYLAVQDFRIALLGACQVQGVTVSTWMDERELRSDPDRVSLKKPDGDSKEVALIPDAFYELHTAKGTLHFFLEWDNANDVIQPSRWERRGIRRKIEAYQALLASDRLQARYGAKSARITLVTTSAVRLAHMKDVSEALGAGEDFWFAYAGDVTPEALLTTPIWFIAGQGDERFSLL